MVGQKKNMGLVECNGVMEISTREKIMKELNKDLEGISLEMVLFMWGVGQIIREMDRELNMHLLGL